MQETKQNTNELVEQILNAIDDDNRANGMYGGLAQFTNGYDAAIERVKNIIKSLKETK